MTKEEALAHFKNHEYMTDFSWQDEMSEIAIKALEKQIAKKPKEIYKFDGGYRLCSWVCPCCETRHLRGSEEVNYCKDCGQKIDWEGEGENEND